MSVCLATMRFGFHRSRGSGRSNGRGATKVSSSTTSEKTQQGRSTTVRRLHLRAKYRLQAHNIFRASRRQLTEIDSRSESHALRRRYTLRRRIVTAGSSKPRRSRRSHPTCTPAVFADALRADHVSLRRKDSSTLGVNNRIASTATDRVYRNLSRNARESIPYRRRAIAFGRIRGDIRPLPSLVPPL